MNLLAAVKRAALFIALCVFVLPMQGCAWTALLFGPSNSARSAELADIAPGAGKTIIVVGLSADSSAVSRPTVVTLSRFDPATKSAGDCGTYHHAKTILAPETKGTSYSAFEVPPGTWVFNYHGATSEGAAPHSYKGTFPAFIAPAGKTTYIGEFVLVSEDDNKSPGSRRSTYRLERDLPEAMRAIGPSAGQMELAQTTPDPDYAPIFCML